jgi:hypothetical protein
MTHSLTEQSSQQRRIARTAGWLMALTFLTSIPAALILYEPVLNEADYILGDGDDARIRLGALLEILLMIGNVGTAVVMFPILRRYSEILALSYVASRTIEATIIGVGAISLLSIVTLRDDLAASIGADGTSLDVVGQTLVAIHDWTFLFGPGFCVGVNGILLGWLMYRTGLMPPRLAMLGVIGGPLIFVSSIAVLFGAYERSTACTPSSRCPRASTTLGIPEGTGPPCALRRLHRRRCLRQQYCFGRKRERPAGSRCAWKGEARCVGETAVSLLDALSDQRQARDASTSLTFAPGREESGFHPKGSVLGRDRPRGRAGRRARTHFRSPGSAASTFWPRWRALRGLVSPASPC